MKNVRERRMALILAILAALVFMGAPARADVGYSIPDFRDVPKSAWYYDYVMSLAEEGIVKGYGISGEFRPFNQVIREHAAKMIVLAAGIPYQGMAAYFIDVDPRGEMSPYIAALVEVGAAGGFPDGTFRPKNNIKRGHAAKIVQIAFELEAGTKPVNISDLPVHDVQVAQAIHILASNGIVKGSGSSSLFKPNDEINRAEMAKILCIARVVQAVQEAEKLRTVPAFDRAQALVDRLSDAQDSDTKLYLQSRLDSLYASLVFVTVNFYANGGETPEPRTKKVAVGSPYGSLATTRHPGPGGKAFQFDGWWTASSGPGTQVLETTEVTQTINHGIYARWLEAFNAVRTSQGSLSWNRLVLARHQGSVLFGGASLTVRRNDTDWMDQGNFSIRVSGTWPADLYLLNFTRAGSSPLDLRTLVITGNGAQQAAYDIYLTVSIALKSDRDVSTSFTIRVRSESGVMAATVDIMGIPDYFG